MCDQVQAFAVNGRQQSHIPFALKQLLDRVEQEQCLLDYPNRMGPGDGPWPRHATDCCSGLTLAITRSACPTRDATLRAPLFAVPAQRRGAPITICLQGGRPDAMPNALTTDKGAGDEDEKLDDREIKESISWLVCGSRAPCKAHLQCRGLLMPPHSA